jgi:hypothetical protein
MIFSISFILALLLTHVAHALLQGEHSKRSITARATFDYTSDNAGRSLNSVSCSNGEYSLVKRYPTFSNIPSYPYIGGAPGVVWNSPYCGGCWQLTNVATGEWIRMTAVDTAATFNLAQDTFKALNGGQIGQGVLDVVAEEVPSSWCRLP